jgi:hypothetical protein
MNGDWADACKHRHQDWTSLKLIEGQAHAHHGPKKLKGQKVGAKVVQRLGHDGTKVEKQAPETPKQCFPTPETVPKVEKIQKSEKVSKVEKVEQVAPEFPEPLYSPKPWVNLKTGRKFPTPRLARIAKWAETEGYGGQAQGDKVGSGSGLDEIVEPEVNVKVVQNLNYGRRSKRMVATPMSRGAYGGQVVKSQWWTGCKDPSVVGPVVRINIQIPLLPKQRSAALQVPLLPNAQAKLIAQQFYPRMFLKRKSDGQPDDDDDAIGHVDDSDSWFSA